MKKIYETPSVVTEEVRVEKGFAISEEEKTFDLNGYEDGGDALEDDI